VTDFYEDSKYGVINRKWFGLTKKAGGDCAAGYTFSGSGSSITHLARWYPRGPIEVIKAGFRVLATLATAANATGGAVRSKHQVKYYKSTSGAMASVMATNHIQVGDASPTAHPRPGLWSIASTGAIRSGNVVDAGQFVSIYVATPTSDDGTMAAAVGTLSDGGTLAFFIDYVPHYSSKWDVP